MARKNRRTNTTAEQRETERYRRELDRVRKSGTELLGYSR